MRARMRTKKRTKKRGPANRLAGSLAGATAASLVILSACGSAKLDSSDPGLNSQANSSSKKTGHSFSLSAESGLATPNSTAQTPPADAGTQFTAKRGSFLRRSESNGPGLNGALSGLRKNVPPRGQEPSDGGILKIGPNSSPTQLCAGGLRLMHAGLNANAISIFSAALDKIQSEASYQNVWVVQNEKLTETQLEAYVYKCRAVGFMNQGDRENAIEDLNQAIRRCPNDASSYSARAQAYQETSQGDLAAVDLAKAQSLDNGN
jgi:hypothetical protein